MMPEANRSVFLQVGSFPFALMQFEQVIGQTSIKKHLADMVQSNRLSHALLFLGKEGVGALPLAIAFSQYIVCENKANGDSCGLCPSCIKSAAFAHPDIHFTFPTIPQKPGVKPISNDFIVSWRGFLNSSLYGNAFDWLQYIGADNKQGNITVEECNHIYKELSLKSFESEFKILVLWMPEYLGEAGNKLLKIIEEPPAKTLFILVAESEEKILPTILSRTQLIKIPFLTDSEIQMALIDKEGIESGRALEIAGISEGNYRSALELLKEGAEDWQSYLRGWLNAVMRGNNGDIIKWVDDISKQGREKQKQFLRYFNHLLGQSIRLRVLGDSNINLSASDLDFAQRLNKIASVSQQETIVEELDKASYYIERNANAKMLFHTLSIKLKYIIQKKTLILTN